MLPLLWLTAAPSLCGQSASDAASRQPALVRIALLLPTQASGIEGGRSLEFQRGFMDVARRHNTEGTGTTTVVRAYEEPGDEASLIEQLLRISADGNTAIVGPVYPKHFAEVADFARRHAIRLFIPFYSRVEQVADNPFVYVVNTPQKTEQELMADRFISTFAGHAVAFMRVGSRNEAAFTAYLRRRLMARGMALTEMSTDSPMEQMRAACSAVKPTVIVPDASDAEGMEQVLKKIEQFRKQYPDARLSLMGYSGWLKGQMRFGARLCAADTYVFATAFFNPTGPATRAFAEDYKTRYGSNLLDVTPCMALLGHDLAEHLIAGIGTYGNAFATQATGARQLQSRICFEQVEAGGGYVNNSAFFVRFAPTGEIGIVGDVAK